MSEQEGFRSYRRRGFLGRLALAAGAALATPGAARADQTKEATPMAADGLTADQVRDLLKLEPNRTCGFVRNTYLSPQRIVAGGLPEPFADARPLGTALYFMLTPAAPVRLHRIRNEQLYHYYLGGPIEVLMLHGDGSSERAVVGPDLARGQRVQLRIPGNTFHTARVLGEWFLGGSTEWPGVVPADVELATNTSQQGEKR